MEIKRGIFRLWICLSSTWVIFCAYELYSHYRASEGWFAAAKIQTGALESERNLMIQNYIFDARDFHNKLLEKGFIKEPFNEKYARNVALSKAVETQSKSEEYQEEQNSYEKAFSERDALSNYWLALPSFPVISALLILCTVWVVRGFKKK